MKAQVPCAACHTDRAAKDRVASLTKTCVDCHDAKYGPMLDQWLKEGAALLTTLSEQTATARVALLDGDRKAAGLPEARLIVEDAEKLIEVLETGRFSHNPELARDAAEKVKARLARVPALVRSAK